MTLVCVGTQDNVAFYNKQAKKSGYFPHPYPWPALSPLIWDTLPLGVEETKGNDH